MSYASQPGGVHPFASWTLAIRDKLVKLTCEAMLNTRKYANCTCERACEVDGLVLIRVPQDTGVCVVGNELSHIYLPLSRVASNESGP